MSYCLNHERSLFGFEDFRPIVKTHHPFVGEIDRDELLALRTELRRRLERERTLGREKRREARGKGPARGGSFPGAHEHPMKRKQVLAAAVKRVNAELRRREAFEARAANVEAAHRALEARRAAGFRSHPTAEAFSAREGMRALPSRRRRPVVHGARIGATSQAGKVAQAARDRRGG